MIENVKTISYSQYTLYSNCPKSWKLKYVDGHREDEKSIHLLFGTSMHETLQEFLNLHYSDKTKFFDLNGLLKERLFENFKLDTVELADGTKVFPTDKATLREFYEDGVAILAHFKSKLKDFFPVKGWELLGVEIPLEVNLTDAVQYVGYLDIVLRDKKSGEIYIYDFKTSTRGWFKEKTDPLKLHQLLLYKKYYADQYKISEDRIFVSFIILKRKVNEKSEWAVAKQRVVKFDPTQGTISTKKAAAALEKFHTSVYTPTGEPILENLVATPSPKACQYCVFKNNKELCPEGV